MRQHRLIQRWGWALLASLSLLPPLTLAFNPPQLQQAARLIDQLIAAAQMGDAAQIEQIRQRIEALPKPPGKPSASDRKEARRYNDLGLERFREERYREALLHFQEGLRRDPGDVEIVANAGHACLMFGDLNCALDHLTIALIIKPARTSTWVPMAETLANLGQVDKAAAAYALAYHFSSNQTKTRTFFETAMLKQDQDPRVIAAIRAAFQSPLMGGPGGAIAMGGGIPTPPPAIGQPPIVADEGEDYTVLARSQGPATPAMPSAIPSAPQQPPGIGPLNVLPTTIGPAVSGITPGAVPSPQPSPQGPLTVLPSSVSVPAQPQVPSAAPVSGTATGALPALQAIPPGAAVPATPMQTTPQVIAQPSPQPAAPVYPQPAAAVGQPPVIAPSALPAGASAPATQTQVAPQVIAQTSPQPAAPAAPSPAAAGQPPLVVPATPNSASEQIQVEAQGIGTDPDSALRNAYTNAIQQALGVYVNAETLVQNDQIIKDEVLTHSRGVIQKVELLNQGVENGLHTVNIRATISKQPLTEMVKTTTKSVAPIDGIALHATIVGEKQQKQAQSILDKALAPLVGPQLFNYEVADYKLDEKDKSTLWISVKVSPNVDAYRQLLPGLMQALEQIAYNKGEVTVTLGDYDESLGYEDDDINKPRDVKRIKTDFYELVSKSSVVVNTWKSAHRLQSKWIVYTLPENIKCQIDPPSSRIEVNLLDEKGNLIAVGQVPGTSIKDKNLSIIHKIRRYGSNSCMISPDIYRYSDYDGRSNYHDSFNIKLVPIKVTEQDLPLIKYIKVDVKQEEVKQEMKPEEVEQ